MKRKKTKNKLNVYISIVTILIVFVSLIYYWQVKKHKNDSFANDIKYSVKGLDVSHHNPILNWKEIKAQNINFVYIKSTEGITHEDRNYIYNYKLAKENNVLVGTYHFYAFGVSGRDQARHFIEVSECNSGDLFPVIDVEHSPSNPYSKDTAFVKLVMKELKILENTLFEYYGVHPIIYTNMNCYDLYIKNNFQNNYIWISSLNKEPKDDIRNWIIWQFSHTGEIKGHTGDFDLNYFRYNIDKLNDIILP